MTDINSETINKFFNFNSVLQQSCAYYSNLAMRQMVVGYQDQHQQPPRQVLGKPCRRQELEESDLEDEEEKEVVKEKGKLKTTQQLRIKIPVVKVVCEENHGHTNGSLGESSKSGKRTGRKVNFADPLSTQKSPTPRNSIDVLAFGALENERTGFTSDSEEEGSDTDVLCDYFRHVQKGDIPIGCSKNRGDANTGMNSDQITAMSSNDMYQSLPRDDEDDNDFFEVPLDEQDYQFMSDIRQCSKFIRAGNNQYVTDGVLNDMQFLYGDGGSPRILEMEETVDQLFAYALQNIYENINIELYN